MARTTKRLELWARFSNGATVTSPSPSTSDHNRRAAPRRALRGAATVEYGDLSKTVQTWDLGRDGMCLLASRPIAPGTRCKVAFELPNGEAPIRVTTAAKVVYSSYSAPGEFKIGAVFTALDDDVARVLERFAASS
jgi:hypothetical protein